jgi:hypothetical protein
MCFNSGTTQTSGAAPGVSSSTLHLWHAFIYPPPCTLRGGDRAIYAIATFNHAMCTRLCDAIAC